MGLRALQPLQTLQGYCAGGRPSHLIFGESPKGEVRRIPLVGNWAKRCLEIAPLPLLLKIAVNSHSGGWTDNRGPVARLTAIPAIRGRTSQPKELLCLASGFTTSRSRSTGSAPATACRWRRRSATPGIGSTSG